MSTPVPRICWGIVITAGVNDTIVFKSNVSDINSGNPVTATLTTPVSYATPEALATAVALALQTAIQAVSGGSGVTVAGSVSVAGVVTLTFAGLSHTFTWKWSTAGGLGQLLGFVDAYTGTDQPVSSPTTSTAEEQVQNFWYPGIPVRTDPRARSTYPRAVVETTGNSVVVVDFVSSPIVRRTVSFENLPACKTLISQEGVGGLLNGSLERLFVPTTGGYSRFYWYDDATVLGTYSIYALREKTAQQFKADRMYDTLELYKTTLEMTTTQ